MAELTISGAGAHASAAATDRIPATKSGVSGYLVPSQIKDYIIALANSWSLAQTFVTAGIKLQDSDASHAITFSAGNESADRTLSIPVLGGADTIMTLGTAQTVTGAKTFDSTLTATSLGTPGALCTAVEHGDGIDHLTVLTLAAFAVGTAGNSVDKAIGATVYTFPSGAICVENGSVKGIFTKASLGTISDGEVGLGSVVGVGAVDTIAEVGATSGDVMLGRALGSYTLGTTVVTAAGTPVTAGGVTAIATGGVKAVFLNIAASWPATADAVTFTGVVTIRWRIIS